MALRHSQSRVRRGGGVAFPAIFPLCSTYFTRQNRSVSLNSTGRLHVSPFDSRAIAKRVILRIYLALREYVPRGEKRYPLPVARALSARLIRIIR